VRKISQRKNCQKPKILYKKNSHRKIMYEDSDGNKLPIEFNRYIDKFVVEAPNGETYYFRDYEGAEDFLLLNFEDELDTVES
tara:strand:+ start:606 stop:851 length:246 start_codon:yes stop_codon:yes gene_type:complete